MKLFLLACLKWINIRVCLTAPVPEPTKAEPQTRSSNQTRSRLPRTRKMDTPIPTTARLPTVVDTVAPVNPHPPRPRGQDSGKHAIRSPKSHSRTPPAQTSGRVMRSRGVPPPPALPSQTPPHQSAAPYRKHKQRSKESQGYRALGPLAASGPVVEKEQVRNLPSVLLYEGGLAQVVQRHEHHHHHTNTITTTTTFISPEFPLCLGQLSTPAAPHTRSQTCRHWLAVAFLLKHCAVQWRCSRHGTRGGDGGHWREILYWGGINQC